MDELEPLMPDLLRHKNEGLEIVSSIVVYSLAVNPPDKKLFFKAIEGLSDEIILQNSVVTHAVIVGLRKFGDSERAQILEEKKSR